MAQGVVVAETPAAGTDVPRGTKITLSVSKGPATTQVPDVTGMSQSTAESLLTGAGLTPSIVYDPVTDPAQDGIVISTDPAPNSDAKSGEVVIIHVGQLQSAPPGEARPPRRRQHREPAHRRDPRRPVERERDLDRVGARVSCVRSSRPVTTCSRSRSAATAAGSSARGRPELPARLPGKEVATTLSDVDVVFPVLHGPFGEDGTVQGLLELAGCRTSAPAFSRPRSAWTRTSSRRCCATTGSR